MIMDNLIDLALHNRLSSVSKNGQSVADEEPFFVADLGQVVRQHRRWRSALPHVHPFYAVKCNADPTLLRLLCELGTGFDCASIAELQSVLSLGVDPSRIVFANPCKTASSLVFSRRVGVTHTTFDNLDELDTIKAYHPDAQLVLRIFASDSDALIDFGEKFGASTEYVPLLLARARELDLNVTGVSFHVGTGAINAFAFIRAIQNAKAVFHQAENQGFQMTLLDIGGGFQDSNFEGIASSVHKYLCEEFSPHVRVIAEPGRYYARSAYTLACKVISRRRQIGDVRKTEEPDMLYQNDGVYGSFMNVIMEKEIMRPSLITSLLPPHYLSGGATGKRQQGERRYSIWGPTCDSLDCVVRDAVLESEVKVGDWLKYKNMGGKQESFL
ncbi:putative ornithine decarboxylase [Aspergillus campestris IBT 28561]|uniref:ornithine decarboxylase n=1 Tax=Aspergillus campestris (strain IBT 28561) TaxID=1392248 RepID=A0A2I1D6D6_ASPC2|nr:putative ornithine decarboxylase [Aspergillus campestris IBT 28561]PKY05442.1 putative ornithine decarboxylase [Aspergillus campestris IBT 28561]